MKALFITAISCLVIAIFIVLYAMGYMIYHITTQINSTEYIRAHYIMYSSSIPALAGVILLFIHGVMYKESKTLYSINNITE